MAAEIVDDQVVGLIEKSLPYLGSAMVATGAFLVKFVGGRVHELTNQVTEHQERIIILEQTYVSREDLESVIDSLQKDLRGSFERAHSRIDEIYRNPRKD